MAAKGSETIPDVKRLGGRITFALNGSTPPEGESLCSPTERRGGASLGTTRAWAPAGSISRGAAGGSRRRFFVGKIKSAANDRLAIRNQEKYGNTTAFMRQNIQGSRSQSKKIKTDNLYLLMFLFFISIAFIVHLQGVLWLLPCMSSGYFFSWIVCYSIGRRKPQACNPASTYKYSKTKPHVLTYCHN